MLKAVVVDSREPDNVKALGFGGVPKMVTELDAGDLWATCDDGAMLVIERKSGQDLLNSIRDNRLFQQAAAIRQRSMWAYLVIVGTISPSLDGHVITDNRSTNWRWDDLQGALLTVQEMGVSVVHCRDNAYEETVIRLARRDRCPERLLQPRINARIMTPAEQALTALPGIGPERAQLLLEEFDGRACDALAWLTWLNTFREIRGIGDVTKQAVRRALGLEENEWLTTMNPTSAEYAIKHSRDEVNAHANAA